MYCSLPGGERSSVKLSDSPVWSLAVETEVSVQFLLDSQHQLVIRVWLAETDCPSPDTDYMLGFAAVDLTPLLSLSVLSGWYNVIDWVGRCRGQIKVAVRPLEPLGRRNNNPSSSSDLQTEESVTQQTFVPQRLETPQVESLKVPSTSIHWTLPQTNLVLDQASISFLESSLARNLQDLESLTAKMVVEEPEETEESQQVWEPPSIENLEDVSLSMLQSRISSQLSSLQMMARQEEMSRVERQELPVLSEEFKHGESDSERSRIGPEGGNTES